MRKRINIDAEALSIFWFFIAVICLIVSIYAFVLPCYWHVRDEGIESESEQEEVPTDVYEKKK